MPVTTINRVKTISYSLSANTGGDINTVYDSSSLVLGEYLLPNYQIVSANTFIKNLKAFSVIESLPEIALPDFELEDSDTDKLYKTLTVEWDNPRKQLDLWLGNSNDGYAQVGSVSILNPSGYPFRVYNLLDLFTDNLALELGNNAQVGVQVKNVGYGVLEGEDKITIHGSYVEEIFCLYPEPVSYIVVQGTGTSNGGGSVPTTPTVGTNWKVKTNDYAAVAGDKLIVGDNLSGAGITITLPNTPLVGDEVSIINIVPYNIVSIDFSYNSYADSNIQAPYKLGEHYNQVTLIYTETLGWIATEPNMILSNAQES